VAAKFRNKISMQPVRSHGAKGPPFFFLVGDAGKGERGGGVGGWTVKAKSSQ
jgi:hypothetical protein